MTMYMNVPLIKQEKTMSCWHASARMIWGYKYKQCINPLSKTFSVNSGLSPSGFIILAKSLGLESVPLVNMSYSWVALADLLKLHGPLWVAGYWYGPAHIIVVTGVSPDGKVYINDPSGVKKVADMLFFNTKIASNVSNPIMYLPNRRVSNQGYGCYFN